MNTISLTDAVEKLPYVGPAYANRLNKLGIITIGDLIFHLPFRYDDFSLISSVNRIQPGETLTIRAKILEFRNEYTRNGKKIQKAVVADDSGSTEIIWFNQPYLSKVLRIGETYQFSGKADWFGRKIVFVSPEYERLSATGSQLSANIHTGRLVPVYPETYGISSKWLRSRIKAALQIFGEKTEEFLPPEIIKKNNLLSEQEAIKLIHFPENKSQAELSRKRLSFDELFLIQLAGRLRKKDWQKKFSGYQFKIFPAEIKKFIDSLPFKLTGAQEKVWSEIAVDLGRKEPMNRLLQGDVGSGKTVVAAIAIYNAFLNNFSSVFMAPTEILATQHYQTLTNFFSPLKIKVELVTSSHRQLNPAEDKSPKIIVGTHALLFKKPAEKIGLIVIDEQQRFGVEQRAQLLKESSEGKIPHLLTMTATPIPRTVALTIFGDLDLSFLNEMPKGRILVKTWVVPPFKREDAYKWIRKLVKGTSQQAFIICPLIEESETLATSRAAKSEYQQLSEKIFPDLKLGLLHGRMKTTEKDQVIDDFRRGKLDILVSTPVVEVGIDIPDATIMMIEAADRFGLAQLHQLRGRVGRNKIESFCLLFTENCDPKAIKRIKFMESKNIGMELAEIDLRLRGPGEIYGTKQHGFPDLKIASFADLDLIEQTRKAADSLLASNFSFLENDNSPLNIKLKKYKIIQEIRN